MPLDPGTRIGAYEVVSSIGRGGMGEVWRARDTKLGREVAVKTLPAEFAGDAERLARFEREARLLASLNHPNIAAIYGVQEYEGTSLLVLELVDGETLADRIQRGRIPVDETIRLATQIVDALEAAHDKGVIHRDLKPANIKITTDGRVKVLDFGLAKVLSENAEPDVSNSPTLSMAATQHGIILGTAGYMSPEQAKGGRVDHRTDVFSFGCVLYEMLTGKRTFEGSDVSETLASVLKINPDWRALPENIPAALHRLLRRSLEKNPKRRLSHIADVRLELEEALHEPEPIAALAVPASPRRTWGPAIAVAALAAVIAALITWRFREPEPPSLLRLSITIPQEAPFATVNDPPVTISPDGSKIVYAAALKGTFTTLMVRRFDQLAATPIPGTERAHTPVFSPDGEWIAFFSDEERSLQKVSLAGGEPLTICEARGSHLGASWGPDGAIVFAGPGLSRVSAAGGVPEALTVPDAARKDTLHAFPDVLPNAKGVLFTATSGTTSRIEVLRFDTRERRVLIENGSMARYAPTGHIVYSQGARLFAVPFDQNTLEVAGAAAPLLEDVAVTDDGPAIFSFSQNGTLLYIGGNIQQGGPRRTLVWVDRQGREEPIGVPSRRYSSARISPDGSQLALEVRDGDTDIWIWNFARATLTRLTFDPGMDQRPVWTPDGKRIAFSSARAGGISDIYVQTADGTGKVDSLFQSPSTVQFPIGFSSDGKRLLIVEAGNETADDISVLPLEGERRKVPLLETPFAERNAELSPDGRWLAYETNESGRPEIYVRPFPNIDGGRWQISTQGGTRPLWAPNGQELFYLSGPGRLFAVTIQTGATFAAGTPELLFEGPYVAPILSREYNVSRDGKRFLMLKNADLTEQGRGPEITVVLNWWNELKQRVPAN